MKNNKSQKLWALRVTAAAVMSRYKGNSKAMGKY
jgi:hypothetical protein